MDGSVLSRHLNEKIIDHTELKLTKNSSVLSEIIKCGVVMCSKSHGSRQRLRLTDYAVSVIMPIMFALA